MRKDHLNLINALLILYFTALVIFICRIVFFTDFTDFINIEKEAARHDY